MLDHVGLALGHDVHIGDTDDGEYRDHGNNDDDIICYLNDTELTCYANTATRIYADEDSS